MNNNPRAILVPIGINLHRWFSVVYSRFDKLGVISTRGLFFAMKFKVSDWRRLEFRRLQLHSKTRVSFRQCVLLVGVLSESDTVLCLCISLGSAVPAMQLPQLPGDTYKSVPDDELNN